MAIAGIGDYVTYHTATGVAPAFVVAKQASNLATLRVLSPTGPDDDYIVGPSSGYTTNPTSVSINSTQDPGTAEISGPSILAQDIRDGAFFFQCIGAVSDGWTRLSPVSTEFNTGTPNRNLWLQLNTTTDITEIDVEVQHDLNSSIRVEVYRTTGSVVTGPDAAYAGNVQASWGWDSGTTSSPQTHVFSIGSVYPGPLSPRLYTVRFISGPNYPGPQTFAARNTICRATTITV